MAFKFYVDNGLFIEQTKEVRHINKARNIYKRATIKHATEFVVQGNGIPVIHTSKRRNLSVPVDHIDAVSDRLIDAGYVSTYDFGNRSLRLS